MTDQEKQELIECCKLMIDVSRNHEEVMIARIALASLTAQPVGYLRAGEANLLNRLKQHEVVEAALFRTMSFRDDVPVFTQSSSSFGLTREERERIVRCVDSLCRRIPGSNFINAAEFTIDEMTNKKAGQ